MEPEQVVFLEQSYGELAEAEDQLKELGQHIDSLNDEIKQMRLLRDAYKAERAALVEKCKSITIDVQSIAGSVVQ